MMKTIHTALIMIGALSLVPVAHAQDPEYAKRTELTFSAPVQLPSMSLPAGTYRFELADPDTDRQVVRVSSEDGKKVYGLLLSIPNQLIKSPGDKQPLVLFQETPAGTPAAVKAWFYPTDSTGYEFVYPHDEALAIARATHQRVRSMEGSAHDRAGYRRAKTGWVDEHGDVSDGPTATSGEDKGTPTDKK